MKLTYIKYKKTEERIEVHYKEGDTNLKANAISFKIDYPEFFKRHLLNDMQMGDLPGFVDIPTFQQLLKQVLKVHPQHAVAQQVLDNLDSIEQDMHQRIVQIQELPLEFNTTFKSPHPEYLERISKMNDIVDRRISKQSPNWQLLYVVQTTLIQTINGQPFTVIKLGKTKYPIDVYIQFIPKLLSQHLTQANESVKDKHEYQSREQRTKQYYVNESDMVKPEYQSSEDDHLSHIIKPEYQSREQSQDLTQVNKSVKESRIIQDLDSQVNDSVTDKPEDQSSEQNSGKLEFNVSVIDDSEYQSSVWIKLFQKLEQEVIGVYYYSHYRSILDEAYLDQVDRQSLDQFIGNLESNFHYDRNYLDQVVQRSIEQIMGDLDSQFSTIPNVKNLANEVLAELRKNGWVIQIGTIKNQWRNQPVLGAIAKIQLINKINKGP